MSAPVIASQAAPAFRIALNAAFVTTYADLQAYADLLKLFHGQCRLVYVDATHLRLDRYNGKYLLINGVHQEIPSAGVSLVSTGLSSTTLYYIYAYMNGSTMTLEAVTTAPAASSTTGVKIKTGAATRTLVGMAFCKVAETFVDAATQRFVASWFNRQRKSQYAQATGDRSVTTVGSLSEFHAEMRCEFVAWADGEVTAHVTGSMINAANSYFGIAAPTIDSTSAVNCFAALTQNKMATAVPLGISAPSFSHADGYHYATMVGQVSATGTVTLQTMTKLVISMDI